MARRQARNPRKENWIVELPADAFRYVVRRGDVIVDLVQLAA